MFLVDVTYIKPLDEVMRLAPAHRAYAATQYAAGRYLLSGRKLPRTGGLILANVDTREEMQAIVAGDPFFIEGVAEYALTELQPVMACDALAHLLPPET